MTRFNVNTSYFQHSTPEYNRKHKEENSKYNHEYYEKNKEKWQDNDKDSSKSGSSEDDEKDSKDKKSGSDSKKSKEDKIKSILGKLNGGSKKGGSATGKKKSSSKSDSKDSSDSKKNKETDEEKAEREAKEKAEKEAKDAEERKKNTEYAEQLKKMHESLTPEKLKEMQNLVKEQEKKNKKKSIKHAAVYVGINSQPYFEHHGRLGMKWGKRNGPPYPLDYSKLSEEERAKDKARVREEGDIESVAYKKNRSYFSDQEINEVINRYQLNTRINQLSADSAKMKAGKSKTEEMLDKMSKVADAGNKLSNALNAGTNVYNNVAKIMNAFGDSDMPIIGQAKQEKKKEFKATKKELDKLIENLETGMGNMTNQELQDALKRKTMYDSLVKDRNATRKEKGEQDVKYYNESEERKASQKDKILSGFHNEGKSFWDKRKNDDIVEHVTGEVVNAGRDWTEDVIYALEDKQRR